MRLPLATAASLICGSLAETVIRDSNLRGKAQEGTDFNDPGGQRAEEASILVALGLLTGAFWLMMLCVSCYMRCWRRRAKKARPEKKRLTADDIERRFPKGNTSEEPTCVVCLSTVEADEPCRTTQCGHTFHADCLEAWWLHKPRKSLHCPVCRQKQRKQARPQPSGEEGEELAEAQQTQQQLPSEGEEGVAGTPTPGSEEAPQCQAGSVTSEVLPGEVHSPLAVGGPVEARCVAAPPAHEAVPPNPELVAPASVAVEP